LRQRLGSLETEINTNQSQFDRVLRIGYKNTKLQVDRVAQQQEKLQKEVAEAIVERDSIKKEADELEKKRRNSQPLFYRPRGIKKIHQSN